MTGVRYVAGLAPVPDRGEMHFSVIRLIEDEAGNRTAQPVFVIGDMTEDQAEHLWMQLGKALGKAVHDG